MPELAIRLGSELNSTGRRNLLRRHALSWGRCTSHFPRPSVRLWYQPPCLKYLNTPLHELRTRAWRKRFGALDKYCQESCTGLKLKLYSTCQ